MLQADRPKSNWRDATERMMLKVHTGYDDSVDKKAVFVQPAHIKLVRDRVSGEAGSHITLVDGAVYYSHLPADEFAQMVRARLRERA